MNIDIRHNRSRSIKTEGENMIDNFLMKSHTPFEAHASTTKHFATSPYHLSKENSVSESCLPRKTNAPDSTNTSGF